MKTKLFLSLLCPAVLGLGLGSLLPEPAATPARENPIRWEGSLITTLKVKDLARSKAFYSKVLGSKVYFDLSQMGWAEMTTPVKNSLIGLSQAEEGKFKANGGGSLSFGVKNIEEVHAWLKKHKVACGEIEEIPKTVKLLEFKDPDGNTLMLHQPYVAPKQDKK